MGGQYWPHWKKILIVEDEENESIGLADLITAWGYRTETATNGLEALEKASTWAPGIILADFMMPLFQKTGSA